MVSSSSSRCVELVHCGAGHRHGPYLVGGEGTRQARVGLVGALVLRYALPHGHVPDAVLCVLHLQPEPRARAHRRGARLRARLVLRLACALSGRLGAALPRGRADAPHRTRARRAGAEPAAPDGERGGDRDAGVDRRPERVAVAVGSGFTGRLTLGQRPIKWSTCGRVRADLRALLRGEQVEWEGGRDPDAASRRLRRRAPDRGADRHRRRGSEGHRRRAASSATACSARPCRSRASPGASRSPSAPCSRDGEDPGCSPRARRRRPRRAGARSTSRSRTDSARRCCRTAPPGPPPTPTSPRARVTWRSTTAT